MSADQAASAYNKTRSQTYKNLVRPLACVSAHSSATFSRSGGIAIVNPYHRRGRE